MGAGESVLERVANRLYRPRRIFGVAGGMVAAKLINRNMIAWRLFFSKSHMATIFSPLCVSIMRKALPGVSAWAWCRQTIAECVSGCETGLYKLKKTRNSGFCYFVIEVFRSGGLLVYRGEFSLEPR
jgi:hypothetical protein